MIIRKIQSSNFWTPPELEYSFLFLLLFNFFSYFQNISILFFQFVKKLQNFLFYIGVYPINNVVIVWSGQQRDSAIHIHEFILPQTPLLLALADAEAEAPVFLSSDANSRLIGKVPDAGKDWEQKGKRVSEGEMVGWHHRCIGHELGQTSRDGEGEGGLACCSPRGRRESGTTGRLNNNNSANM